MTHARSLRMLAILILTASALPAQQADPQYGQLVPFGTLEAKLDDRVLNDAEIYFAERAGAYLLLSSSLAGPLLIDVRGRKVDRVSAAKVQKNDDGSASLLAGAVAGEVGPFEVAESQLKVSLADGRQLTLGPKPPLLGLHTAEELLAHDPGYAYRGRVYPPNEKTMDELRKETRDVTVRVYFGSWCHTCARMVPWILVVGKALEGSHIHFEYYGLPPTMDDPVAEKAGVHGVPTMVVSVGGKELGRGSAPDVGVPEKVLMQILGGS